MTEPSAIYVTCHDEIHIETDMLIQRRDDKIHILGHPEMTLTAHEALEAANALKRMALAIIGGAAVPHSETLDVLAAAFDRMNYLHD